MPGRWLTLVAALLVPCLGGLSPALLADVYYDHPPGCLWSTLIETNAEVAGVAIGSQAIGGAVAVVVAANYEPPVGGDLTSWGLLYKLSPDSGVLLLATNFHGEGVNNRIRAIVPMYSSLGDVMGFAFTGEKDYHCPPYSLPWTWVVKTDLDLVKQAEAHVGIVSNTGRGCALASDGSDLMAAGEEGYVNDPPKAWFGQFTSSLNLVAQTNVHGSCNGISGFTHASGGGHVLATRSPTTSASACSSFIKINEDLEFEWAGGEMATNALCDRTEYFRIIPLGSSNYVALGRSYCPDQRRMVLTRFGEDGSVVQLRSATNATGAELLTTPDLGYLLVGTSYTRRPGGVPCVWLIKMDSAWQTSWEMFLGGEHGARAAAGARPGDGRCVVAGKATLANGMDWVWVFRMDATQPGPGPVFIVTPSPVFRGQEVTFDATASTAPGSAIAAYEWDFGDGTTNSGALVRHTYSELGTNTVTLTVVNTNGVLAYATQQVVVVGMELQWERFYGQGRPGADDVGLSLVESWDGGFVVAGGTAGTYVGDRDFWIFKTDARGRLVWSRTVSDPNPNGGAQAQCVIRAHDSGYVVAGLSYAYTTYWYYEPWLLKLDEAGEPAWPIRVYGAPTQDETAYGVTRSSDGGYLLTGFNRPGGGDIRHHWVLKTDGDGIEVWNRVLTNGVYSGGRSVVPTADGGYLVTGAHGYEVNGPPTLTYKTDSTGAPVWTNSTGSGGSFEGGGRWVAETPGGGAVVVGGNRDIFMLFIDPDGKTARSLSWGSPDSSDYLDMGEGAATTPDGGYIVCGYMSLKNTVYWQQQEVALIKTDSAGNTNWIELLPGTTNLNEVAYGVVALTNSACVVLAHREIESVNEPNKHSVWLFKLGTNRPPVPHMSASPSPAAPGQLITFDGSASSDPDGTIAAWEWDFGDGATNSGAIVQHTYTNAGSFPVRLTVLDNGGAERTITNWTCAVGITALSAGVTVTLAEVTNTPAADPVHYPPAGAPANLDWISAYGFRLGATGPNGNQVFRIAFCGVINTNYVLYRLPAWASLAYTNVNQVAIDVTLPIAGGVLNTNLVLARAIPRCTIVQCHMSGADRLALTFTTDAGHRYRVMRSEQLVPADWQPVNHARAAGDPLALETLDGSGVAETVYVERPAMATAFFRVKVE